VLYLNTKCHMPIYNSSLVITIKQKAKHKFHADIMLFDVRIEVLTAVKMLMLFFWVMDS
jgi:hypothetical protein